MWFAALGRFDDERWFQNFCVRLLDADERVLRLLARDPFQGRKPRYLRAVLYRYRFADAATERRDGVWWTRERLGEYSPILSLSAASRENSRQARTAPDGPPAATRLRIAPSATHVLAELANRFEGVLDQPPPSDDDARLALHADLQRPLLLIDDNELLTR